MSAKPFSARYTPWSPQPLANLVLHERDRIDVGQSATFSCMIVNLGLLANRDVERRTLMSVARKIAIVVLVGGAKPLEYACISNRSWRCSTPTRPGSDVEVKFF